MYDVIIIGAGPAGVSASLYIKRANLNVLVLYHGKTNLTNAKIENYYGFPDGIDGEDLYKKGIKQAKNLGVEIKEAEVIKIENNDKEFIVKTLDNEFESKGIILATGNKKVKPNIQGIQDFEGKGISYCAICDAFFYRNKNVGIIGNGNYAVSQAEELENIVSKVTIFTNGLEKPNCKFDVNTERIKRINGVAKVENIEFEDGNTVHIDGIFIALGEAGAGDFAKSLGIIQDGENIKVNDKMETNIPGVFACGDITKGIYQVSKAVYEGAVAGLSAVQYIKENRGEK